MDSNVFTQQLLQGSLTASQRCRTDWGYGHVEQLMQLFNGVTWDGNLIDKICRDKLVKGGLATKQDGYNLITRKGVKYLYRLGIVHP